MPEADISSPQPQARLSATHYARAESFLPWNVKRLVFNLALEPHWIKQDDEETDRFWYRRETSDGATFMLVDPARGTVEPAFDHVRLASALSLGTDEHYVHNRLPFNEIEFVEDDKIAFTLNKKQWTCDLAGYHCEEGEATEEKPKNESRSPDDAWAVFVQDGDLVARSTSDGSEHQLTTDAEEYYNYGTRSDAGLTAVTDRLINRPVEPGIVWSPDSSKLLSYRLDQREVSPIHLLQSVPTDGGHRPVAHAYRYPLPGDEHIALAELVIIDVPSGEQTWVKLEPIQVARVGESKSIWWSEDGSRIYVVHSDRSYRRARLTEIDAASGEARTVIDETGSTYTFPQPVPGEITNVRVTKNGDEATWWSERDGWGHLYLYDTTTGEPKQQITHGAWQVRDIQYLDETERRVYFTGGGREEGIEPYFRLLYRCKLDGSQLELLTPEDADHTIRFSPSGAYFIDTYSRVDQAPVSVLRAADGRLLCQLEEGDIAALLETGWRYPERFSVKARDGVTDIYGMIIRPSHYDLSKRYPVLDAIYPGPQIIRTPKSFPDWKTQFWQDQALAELGFIVVTIDGQGTPFRSKAFIDVAYGERFNEAGGLADHVAGIKQLGAHDPSMDIERVGIYGHSGGGYASTKALLTFPDFYKAAVSSAGNHDQQGYNASWGERYIGPYDAATYAPQDNTALAANLKGRLLLVHGELDDNVHPTLTMRLVDALIAANKDFEMLVIPFTNHGFFDSRWGYPAVEKYLSQSHPYFVRRRWDHFVKSLLGAEPPAGYRITPMSLE